MIPGGTPFSQLNKGVKDAMVVSTELVIRQVRIAKTCNKAILTNNNNPHICRQGAEREPSTNSGKRAKEGSGEVTRTAPTPEQQIYRRRGYDGFGETQWEAPTPEPVCKLRKKRGYSCNKWYKMLAFNWVFLVKSRLCEILVAR